MKKICLLIVTLLALSLFWGCGKAQPEQAETAEKPQTDAQTPPKEEIPPEETEKETPPEETEQKYPVVLEVASSTGYFTPESVETDTPCQVRLYKEQKNSTADFHLFLEITAGETVIQEDLTVCIGPVLKTDLYSKDVDGDGIEDLIIHYDTGGCGGYGSYISWVIKVEQEKLNILFSSDVFPRFDTGFESRFVSGYQMEVKNRFCDYSLTFPVKEAYKTRFDENGEPTADGKIELDPFYEFVPQDADGDGKYEIACKQYASYLYHNDCTGSACCILEYNTATNTFEVTDAWFEPNIEE